MHARRQELAKLDRHQCYSSSSLQGCSREASFLNRAHPICPACVCFPSLSLLGIRTVEKGSLSISRHLRLSAFANRSVVVCICLLPKLWWRLWVHSMGDARMLAASSACWAHFPARSYRKDPMTHAVGVICSDFKLLGNLMGGPGA